MQADNTNTTLNPLHRLNPFVAPPNLHLRPPLPVLMHPIPGSSPSTSLILTGLALFSISSTDSAPANSSPTPSPLESTASECDPHTGTLPPSIHDLTSVQAAKPIPSKFTTQWRTIHRQSTAYRVVNLPT